MISCVSILTTSIFPRTVSPTPFSAETKPPEVAIIEESQPLEVAKRLVQRGKRVTIKDRAFIVSLVRRTYGRMFDYEVDAAAASGENGHAGAPSSPNVDMGNPSSSYRR